MSYLFPINGADIGHDRFEPTRFDGVRADDDDRGEEAEREPFEGGLRSGRGEMRSTIDEMREFRLDKREDCERHERRDRDGHGIGPEREPRRPL